MLVILIIIFIICVLVYRYMSPTSITNVKNNIKLITIKHNLNLYFSYRLALKPLSLVLHPFCYTNAFYCQQVLQSCHKKTCPKHAHTTLTYADLIDFQSKYVLIIHFLFDSSYFCLIFI